MDRMILVPFWSPLRMRPGYPVEDAAEAFSSHGGIVSGCSGVDQVKGVGARKKERRWQTLRPPVRGRSLPLEVLQPTQ